MYYSYEKKEIIVKPIKLRNKKSHNLITREVKFNKIRKLEYSDYNEDYPF
jgi:hypothetical protein